MAFAVTCLLFMLCIYPVINAVLMCAVTDKAEQRLTFSRDVLMCSPFPKENRKLPLDL